MMHTNRFWGLRKPLSVVLAIGLMLTAGPVGAQEPPSDSTDTGSGPAVIGGSVADPKDFPYYVMLTDKDGYWYCGGTLIRDRWVLTAAHCTIGSGNKDVYVRFGAKSDTKYVDLVRSDKVITHPGYHGDVLRDPDIALIRLERKPKMSSPYIAKTKFVTRGKVPKVGTSQQLIGYGQSTLGGKYPKYLQAGKVKVKACTGVYEGADNDKDNICAGGLKTTSCYGDSGGPLLVNNKVAGIVSYGEAGCRDKEYGVYTRVSRYSKWIRNQIKKNRDG